MSNPSMRRLATRKKYRAWRKAQEANDWYERTVGYRPQEDDPSMTDVELFALCDSMREELAVEA